MGKTKEVPERIWRAHVKRQCKNRRRNITYRQDLICASIFFFTQMNREKSISKYGSIVGRYKEKLKYLLNDLKIYRTKCKLP